MSRSGSRDSEKSNNLRGKNMASVPEPFVTINGQMPSAGVSLLLERRWFYSNLVENTADPSQEKNVAADGLCADCVHARRIESERGSVFILCELSRADPRFPQYPRLPVLSCEGYKKKL